MSSFLFTNVSHFMFLAAIYQSICSFSLIIKVQGKIWFQFHLVQQENLAIWVVVLLKTSSIGHLKSKWLQVMKLIKHFATGT